MPLSFPPRRGRNIRPCLVALLAVSVSYDVARLGILVEPTRTLPPSGPAGRDNHYKLRIAHQRRHVHLLWQIMCPHLRIAKACPCNHPWLRTRCLPIRPHSERRRTSRQGTANRRRMKGACRRHLLRLRILSGASQSPILTNPVRLITPQLTKVTLSRRIRPPWYRHRCLLTLWRSPCPLRCLLHLHLPFSWRCRSLTRYRFRYQ